MCCTLPCFGEVWYVTYFYRVHRAMPKSVLYTVVLRLCVKRNLYIYGKRPTKETYATYFEGVHGAMPKSVLYTAVLRLCVKRDLYIYQKRPNLRCIVLYCTLPCCAEAVYLCVSKKTYIHQKRPTKQTYLTFNLSLFMFWESPWVCFIGSTQKMKRALYTSYKSVW